MIQVIKVSDYQEELEVALETAEKAGEVMEKYLGEHETWEKEDGSIVTEADTEAQEVIVETISEKFPGDGFLGEENDLKPDGEKRVWIIDPIDGTFNFEKGFPYFCTSIALKIDGKTVVGIVHSPKCGMDETFFAAENGGSYRMKDGKITDLEVTEHKNIEDSNFFLTTFDTYRGEFEKEKEVLQRLVDRNAAHRQLGAAALELSYIASGRADAFINPIIKSWDFGAGKLIVEEAGGEVRIRESCFPDSYEVIATNGKLQDEIEDVVGKSFQ